MRRFASATLCIVILTACQQAPAPPPPQQQPVQQAEREFINLPTRSVQAPFSDAVLVGNTLYLSGRIGLDPATSLPPADAAQEARLLLEQYRSVLAEAEMTMDDLVFVQVFASDVGSYDTWNTVYREFLSDPFPARAFIGSGPLLFGARFEMVAIAVGR